MKARIAKSYRVPRKTRMKRTWVECPDDETLDYVFIEVGMTVTLPYDPVWEPLEWAKKNCSSYITNAVHSCDNTKIDYFFANKKDALMFILRWS